MTNAVLLASAITSNGNLNLTTSNAGITFNNSSALTNSTLNDYETGTWTPILSFGGASVGITYSNRSGIYTKIGNMVFATFNITTSNIGSSTGGAVVSGLPFTSNTVASATGYLQADNLTFSGSPVMYMPTNGTAVNFYYEVSGAVSNALTNTAFASVTTIRVVVTYQATF